MHMYHTEASQVTRISGTPECIIQNLDFQSGLPRRRLFLSLLMGVVMMAGLTGARAESGKLTSRLQEIQVQVETYTQRLEKEEGRRGALDLRLRHTEQTIAQVAGRLRRSQERLQQQQKSLRQIKQTIHFQKISLNARLQSLRKEIISIYERGREPTIQLLLEQENPAQLDRMMDYLRWIEVARKRPIEAARKALVALNRSRLEAKMMKRRLVHTVQKLRSQRESLQSAQRARQQVMLGLEKTINNNQKRLQSLRANERQLRKLLASVGRAVTREASLNGLNQKPFLYLKGSLPWPVSGQIITHFNSPRQGVEGALRWHSVFISAPVGRYVRAIYSGRIVFTNWLRGYGLLLIVDHGRGFMTLYGHTQAIYRPVGAWVRQGEIIASVGDSGGLNRAGLYFAIRHDGKPLNPARWCLSTPYSDHR